MKPEDPLQFMRLHIHQHVQSLTGSTELATGVELAALLRLVSNLYDIPVASQPDTGEVSRARWRILSQLLAEAQRGNTAGLNPTYLSQCLHVSKNTISSLLRGLEKQGLIQRVLDPQDHRRFCIQLTKAGQALVESSAPQQIAYLNFIISDLTPAEQEQLLTLLVKLYHSLVAHTVKDATREM